MSSLNPKTVIEYEAPNTGTTGPGVRSIFRGNIQSEKPLALVPKAQDPASTGIKVNGIMDWGKEANSWDITSAMRLLNKRENATLYYLYNILKTPADKLDEHSILPWDLRDLQSEMKEIRPVILPIQEGGREDGKVGISLEVRGRPLLFSLSWDNLVLVDLHSREPFNIQLPTLTTSSGSSGQRAMWELNQYEKRDKLVSECIRKLIRIKNIESRKSDIVSSKLWSICSNPESFYMGLNHTIHGIETNHHRVLWLWAIIRRIDECIQYVASLETLEMKRWDELLDTEWENELKRFYSEKISEMYAHIGVLITIILSQYGIVNESDLSEWVDIATFDWVADNLYHLHELKVMESKENLAYFIKTIRTAIEKCIAHFENLKAIEGISDDLLMPKYTQVVGSMETGMSRFQQSVRSLNSRLNWKEILNILKQLNNSWILAVVWRVRRLTKNMGIDPTDTMVWLETQANRENIVSLEME